MRAQGVMLYGTSTNKDRDAAYRAALGCFNVGPEDMPCYRYAEHAPGGLALDTRKDSRAIAARRRNEIMAMVCVALVVIGRPRYATAIVRSFRARGRRVYWYNLRTGRMTEPEPTAEYVRVNWHTRAQDAPERADIIEAQSWERAKAERQERMDTFSVPLTFYRYDWTNKHRDRRIRRPFLSILPWEPRSIDALPTYGWTEKATDTHASRRKDVCERDAWYLKRHAEKDWERRRKENSGPATRYVNLCERTYEQCSRCASHIENPDNPTSPGCKTYGRVIFRPR